MNLNADFYRGQHTNELYDIIGRTYANIGGINERLQDHLESAKKEKDTAERFGEQLSGSARARYLFNIGRANALQREIDNRLTGIKMSSAELKRRGLFAPK